MGSFTRVEQSLPPGRTLGFAVNAGMFHPDLRPVGLYIEDGRQEMRIVTSDGPGNFGLLPNGVFWIQEARAQVDDLLDRTGCLELLSTEPGLDHRHPEGEALPFCGPRRTLSAWEKWRLTFTGTPHHLGVST